MVHASRASVAIIATLAVALSACGGESGQAQERAAAASVPSLPEPTPDPKLPEKLAVCDALVPALQDFVAAFKEDAIWAVPDTREGTNARGKELIQRIGDALPDKVPTEPDSYSNAVAYVFESYPVVREQYLRPGGPVYDYLPWTGLMGSTTGLDAACSQLPRQS